jgi:hypothetical protein
MYLTLKVFVKGLGRVAPCWNGISNSTWRQHYMYSNYIEKKKTRQQGYFENNAYLLNLTRLTKICILVISIAKLNSI